MSRGRIEHIEGIIRNNDLVDAPDLNERLIRELAWTVRYRELSDTGRLIFGTQVAALKEIAASGALSAASLEKLHSEHEIRVKDAGIETAPFDFLTWIAFLRDRGLIVRDDQGRYTVTSIGSAFIQFAAANHVTEARDF